MPDARSKRAWSSHQLQSDRQLGPWVALTPGSRRAYHELVDLAEGIAAAGYRVLLHDRRNCGASDVAFDGSASEHEVWADDLHALGEQLNALPMYVGGSSAGARLAILFALRHPKATKGMLLWRLTGGQEAVDRLAESRSRAVHHDRARGRHAGGVRLSSISPSASRRGRRTARGSCRSTRRVHRGHDLLARAVPRIRDAADRRRHRGGPALHHGADLPDRRQRRDPYAGHGPQGGRASSRTASCATTWSRSGPTTIC